jgi:hypothetical protein
LDREGGCANHTNNAETLMRPLEQQCEIGLQTERPMATAAGISSTFCRKRECVKTDASASSA